MGLVYLASAQTKAQHQIRPSPPIRFGRSEVCISATSVLSMRKADVRLYSPEGFTTRARLRSLL